MMRRLGDRFDKLTIDIPGTASVPVKQLKTHDFEDLDRILQLSHKDFSCASTLLTDDPTIETQLATFREPDSSVALYNRPILENTTLVLAFSGTCAQMNLYDGGMNVFRYKTSAYSGDIKKYIERLFVKLKHPHPQFALENIIDVIDPDSHIETMSFEQYNSKALMDKFKGSLLFYSTKSLEVQPREIKTSESETKTASRAVIKGYWFHLEPKVMVAVDPCSWKHYYHVVIVQTDPKPAEVLKIVTVPLDLILTP